MGRNDNQVRTGYLGLPNQTWVKHRAVLDSTPSLLLASSYILPRPADRHPHLSRPRLTAHNLAAAITEATTNRLMQEKAAGLGAKIAAQAGVCVKPSGLSGNS